MATVVLRPPATGLDWSIIKGDSFDLAVPVRDALNAAVDVTGWTAKAQIRRSESEPVLHEWSAGHSNITIVADEVLLTVDGTVTALWPWKTAQISVEVTDTGGKPHTIAYGIVRALEQITQ